ncbi:hypothetical protein FLA_3899 [Filimonas lacunae]|nr:hypothetical protein FLA_3899 [Filimonas lacunae]
MASIKPAIKAAVQSNRRVDTIGSISIEKATGKNTDVFYRWL